MELLNLQVAAYVTSMAMAWLGGLLCVFLSKGLKHELKCPFGGCGNKATFSINLKPPLRGLLMIPPSVGQTNYAINPVKIVIILLFSFLARSVFGYSLMHYFPIFFAQQIRNIFSPSY
jgi:hypothetical protein